ncbi:MAG: transposase family protein [Chlorobi bacterium]|nr:transposase family protein [Chlorobiota bacterium]
MRYAEICDRSPEQFRRLTGVLPTTFEAMLKVIRAARREFGRPPKLVLADQLLLTLLYWREYRAQYHLAADFGISEPTSAGSFGEWRMNSPEQRVSIAAAAAARRGHRICRDRDRCDRKPD